jgi:hypothetical protein
LKEYEFGNISIFLLQNCWREEIDDVLREPAPELMGTEFLKMFLLIV